MAIMIIFVIIMVDINSFNTREEWKRKKLLHSNARNIYGKKATKIATEQLTMKMESNE